MSDSIGDDLKLLAGLAGHALAGMLANPKWIELAKEECSKPGRGDIPDYLATTSLRYAHVTLAKISSPEVPSALERKLAEWIAMPDAEMRLRCGELSAQEIRSVRAVLSTLASLDK